MRDGELTFERTGIMVIMPATLFIASSYTCFVSIRISLIFHRPNWNKAYRHFVEWSVAPFSVLFVAHLRTLLESLLFIITYDHYACMINNNTVLPYGNKWFQMEGNGYWFAPGHNTSRMSFLAFSVEAKVQPQKTQTPKKQTQFWTALIVFNHFICVIQECKALNLLKSTLWCHFLSVCTLCIYFNRIYIHNHKWIHSKRGPYTDRYFCGFGAYTMHVWLQSLYNDD